MWRAADAVLDVYQRAQKPDVQYKEDQSPLTEADLASHAVLTQGLQALTPSVPILSEESSSLAWQVRQNWGQYWLIDPLDGTKEFIAGNNEFTVNVALIDRHAPVSGWVAVPAQAKLYVGDVACSESYLLTKDGQRRDLQCRTMPTEAPAVLVASRRHRGERLDQLLAHLHDQLPAGLETRPIGSALKFCLLAEGAADLYPRLAPTSEWDTAAAQAVLAAAGGEVFTPEGEPLLYNNKESLLNTDFVAVADKSYGWRALIISALKS